MHQVGDHQQRLRRLERRVVLGGHRGELVDGVDRHELDARALVKLAGRTLREHAPSIASRRVAVPIVEGVLNQSACAVEQREVDAPGVDADGVERRPRARLRAGPRALRRRAAGRPSSVPRVRTGTFGKRCTVETASRSPSKRPIATRPLWAPRSTEAIVAISARAPRTAGGGGDRAAAAGPSRARRLLRR